MIMPRKKRIAVKISVTLIVVIILVVVVLYIKTDMFKSNQTLFSKYARQLFDNMNVILNEAYIEQMEEIINNNKLTSETTVTLNYTGNGENTNPINNIQMNISGQEEKASGYNYKNITLSQNEETLFGVEYIEDNQVAGVRLNGIRQYVSTNIESENENEIYNLYNFIHTDIAELLKISEDEWNVLKEKYLGIILEDITNANFSKQSGVALEIDGTQYTANAYSVTITKEEFNNIYIQVLEELEKNEIILSKIESIDSEINKYHDLLQDGKVSDMKQEFIDRIQGEIQTIQNSNIGNDERTISVYEANGVAISLLIDTEENSIGLDFIQKEGMNFVNLFGNEKIEEGEEENSFDISVEKNLSTNDESINVIYTIVEEGEETTNECNTHTKIEDSNINSNINLIRSVGENTLELQIEAVANIVDDFEEKQELVEDENNILIENLDEEQEETVRSTIEENIANQVNAILQVISLDDVNQMLINLKLKEEELDDISNGGIVTESERNRFNSTFELFEGEHISKERVEELINLAKEDLGEVRISNYREEREGRIPLEYRLVIERNTDNSELAKSVIDYIEENYSEEFSIRLEYDDTTGLVNNIYMTVMEN